MPRRRLYEVVVSWETAHTLADQPPFIRDFAEIWQAADKIGCPVPKVDRLRGTIEAWAVERQGGPSVRALLELRRR